MSTQEKNLLAMGTKFIPTPRVDINELKTDMDTFTRRVRLKYEFRYQDDPDFKTKFHIAKKTYIPSIAPRRVEAYLSKTKADLLMAATASIATTTRTPRNLTSQQLRILRSLENHQHLIVKPADKNLGLVLMDRTWYDQEVERQLSDITTYKPVAQDTIPVQQIYLEIVQIASRMARDGFLTPQELNFIKNRTTPDTSKIPQIYILPKIHKKPVKGRPIIPGHSWIATPASVLLDDRLQVLLTRATTVIPDTKTLINQIERLIVNDKGCWLITADVSSLYTEIDTNKGIALMWAFMRQNGDLFPPTLIGHLHSLLRIVMTRNYLRFKDKTYHQIKGTAMGTPVAPVYANIFMFILERAVLKRYDDRIIYYRRYLDDIFMLVKTGPYEDILQSFQTMEKNIKLEFRVSNTDAVFLDLYIHKGQRFQQSGILDLKVYQKELNYYLYTPFSSWHTPASKGGLIITELKRYVRNSSSRDDYITIKRAFYERLRARGYPRPFLAKYFDKVKYADRTTLLTTKPRTKVPESTVFFTTTFNPLTRSINLNRMIKKHLGEFKDDPDPITPMIGYKTGPNIASKICRNN